MKKILFFETTEFTGATRVTRTLAKAAKQKYEVAFAKVGDNIKEEIESAIEVENPDILFSSFIKINPEIIEVGKAKGLTVVIRTDFKLSDISEKRRIRIEETYPLADCLIAQTEEMGNELKNIKGVKPGQVLIIENPIDEEEIQQKAMMPNPFKDNGCFHFIWVGREDPIKDLTTLKTAFEQVHKQYPDTDLTLVTNDENPYRWMKNADCLVISSKSEASPNVLREALFLGTPVISTDCSPTVRKLLPAKWIVPVGNHEEMAIAMQAMIIEKIVIDKNTHIWQTLH